MSELKQYKMFIDGEWVDSDTKKTFETLNPENNKPWAEVPEASATDVDRAVKAAQKAFEGEWPKLLPRERGKYLRTLADKLRENAELLGEIETKDTGKLFRETKKQANYIAEYYDYYAGMADKVEGTVLPIDKPNIQAITTRVPIGVIAAIIPWNSQMLLTVTKLAPALAMGNTVVIKSSELAPAVLFEFAKLVEETGIPKGVVNVITGFGDPCGKELTTHNLVEKIAFTGGPETARHIIRNSAENLSEVSLELGGKSPVAVFEDANQENAINGITAGIFGASGQSCIAGSRLYIQNEIYEETMRKVEGQHVQLNAVLVRDVTLPTSIKEAIQRKLTQEQEALEYEFRLEKARQEAEKVRIEAEGKAVANRLLAASLTPNILKDKGIEATLLLAESPNTKIIVVGGGEDGLPLILGNQ